MEHLEDIEVGDVVVVHGEGFGSRQRRLARVEKITKLYFYIKRDGTKYRKRDGWPAGHDSWCRVFVARPKPGEIDEVNAEVRASNDRHFVLQYIDEIRNTPEKFTPIARFIRGEDNKKGNEQ